MSDYEGNVHQMGDAADYEPEEAPRSLWPRTCMACGHDEDWHDMPYDSACFKCDCVQFTEDYPEPEEVEER